MALLKKKQRLKKGAEEAAQAKEAKQAKAKEAAEAEEAKEAKPPKKRRLKKDSGGAEEDGAAAEQDARAEEAADPAAEEKRRDAQRQIQQLVKKLREEGTPEKKITEAKLALKKKLGVMPKGKKASKNKEWLQSEEAWEQRNESLHRKHDLVVIPVVWRSRHDSFRVHDAAQDIKDCLMQQGVDVWIDKRRKYTPGSKFAFWEYAGIMLRIEVGPKDIEEGVCKVCLAKKAGDYQSVERRSVRLPPAGTRALLLALKDLGLSKIDVERRPGEEDGEEAEVPEAAGTKKGAPPAAPRGDDDLEGNVAGPPPKEPKEKAKRGKKRKVVKK